MAENDIALEQVNEYCRKRCLTVISTDWLHSLQLAGQKFATDQLAMETKTVLEAKNAKLTSRNMLLIANVQHLEAENASLRFRYGNMKNLLNQFIATGLIPSYFDIYNQVCALKHKLKDARKEAAAANKRYKQLKKEFSRYRNEHTDSDCNPYLAKIRDLEQQIEAMNAHRERMSLSENE